jgi:hypothetical protein
LVRFVAAFIGIAVAMTTVLATLVSFPERTPSLPPPPSSGDGFDLFIDAVKVADQYGGARPTHGYWLVVTATVRNTGSTSVRFEAQDWAVSDSFGRFRSQPDSRYDGSQWFYPSEYITYWLPFDLAPTLQPDRVILTLPTGREISSSLSGGPRAVGTLLRRSNDGTNWTLEIVSRPDGLTTSETTLAIFTGTGAIALADTPLSELNYEMHQVKFEPRGDGIAVSILDRLLVSTAPYPAGYRYSISAGTTVFSAGTFEE